MIGENEGIQLWCLYIVHHFHLRTFNIDMEEPY